MAAPVSSGSLSKGNLAPEMIVDTQEVTNAVGELLFAAELHDFAESSPVSLSARQRAFSILPSFYSPGSISELNQAGYHGFATEGETLEQLLESQNYAEILKRLWTENNLPKRIEWLRAHTEGNALFMLELSRTILMDRQQTGKGPIIDAIQWHARGLCNSSLDVRCRKGTPAEILKLADKIGVCYRINSYLTNTDVNQLKLWGALFFRQALANERYSSATKRSISWVSEQDGDMAPDQNWAAIRSTVKDRLKARYLPPAVHRA